MGKTIDELQKVLSLCQRMGLINEATVKDRINTINNGTITISNPNDLLTLFSKYEPHGGWFVNIGYITDVDKIDGKSIVGGRDDNFSPEEMQQIDSYGDDELSAYAKNPVFSRKKYKHPWVPESGTNYLFKFDNFQVQWSKNSGDKYQDASNRARLDVDSYINNNPQQVAAYKASIPTFDQDYEEWANTAREGGAEDYSEDAYIRSRLTGARGKNTKSKYERVPYTPFKRNTENDQLMFSMFKANGKVTYSKRKYYLYNPDTKQFREVSADEAEGISRMFVSQAESKSTKVLTDLEKAVKDINNSYHLNDWLEYNLNSISKITFSFTDENGEKQNFKYVNKDIVTRISKAKKLKSGDVPEVYSQPGALSGFDDMYAEEEE